MFGKLNPGLLLTWQALLNTPADTGRTILLQDPPWGRTKSEQFYRQVAKEQLNIEGVARLIFSIIKCQTDTDTILENRQFIKKS